jgi:STE24 endopeptidase
VNEDRAARYQRLGRRASVLELLISGSLLVVLILTDSSIALRDLAVTATAGLADFLRPAAVVAVYVVLLAALNEALTLPLAFYRGHLLERRYGLAAQSGGAWLRDHVKAGLLGLILILVACEVLYACLRYSPEWWWAITGGILSAAVITLAILAPVILLPLFYHFTPIQRDELRERLVMLAARAGARVVGAYEWRVSDRTHKANAALTGLGSTRRILLSDTLLSTYSDDEIEVILAHELGHHVHRDIWVALACQAALLLAGLYCASRLLEAGGQAVGLTATSDVAGLPLVALAAGGLSLVLVPIANALSRAHEYRADRFAIDLTGNPAAFISAMKRLAAQNLAEELPSRLVEILFHTHPPTARRIALARAWDRQAPVARRP